MSGINTDEVTLLCKKIDDLKHDFKDESSRLNSAHDRLDDKIENIYDKLEKKMDSVRTELDNKIISSNSDLNKRIDNHFKITVTLLISSIIGIVGVAFKFLSLIK